MSDETQPYKAGFEAMYERMHGEEKCVICGTVLNIHGCLNCGAPVCCPKCCDKAEHETDIVFRLRHQDCEDMTTLIRDAVNEILSLRIIASNHRDGRLDALEKLAKRQGPALDIDVWPNAKLRGASDEAN